MLLQTGEKLVISCRFYDGRHNCLIRKPLKSIRTYRAAELKDWLDAYAWHADGEDANTSEALSHD